MHYVGNLPEFVLLAGVNALTLIGGFTISPAFCTITNGSCILLNTGTLNFLPPDIIPGGIPVVLIFIKYPHMTNLAFKKTPLVRSTPPGSFLHHPYQLRIGIQIHRSQ